MPITDDDLRTVVLEMWAPAVGLPVIEAPPTAADAHQLEATLEIIGAWNGAVCIDASEGFTRTLAATMFGIDPDNATTEDELDAIGEMANVIGGNVKTLATEAVEDLGLPVTGPAGSRGSHGDPVASGSFAVGGDPVRVTICQAT